MAQPFLHQEVPATVRVAQVLSITAAAFLAGQTASVTYLFTPSLLQAPAPLLARQWKTSWMKARATAPVATAGLSLLFGWFAWREPSTSAVKFYSTSSVIFASVIPYTLLVMGPYNRKLLEKADSLASTSLEDAGAEAGVSKDETVHALLDKWATLNLVRALASGIAAISAAWAALDHV